MSANLARIFAVAEPERLARLREFRLAAHLLLGRWHPVTAALGAALADPGAIGEALAEVDRLEAIPRRRLLATLAAILPAGSRRNANPAPVLPAAKRGASSMPA